MASTRLGDAGEYCGVARVKLHDLRVFESSNGTPVRNFFPLDRLRRHFSRGEILRILNCTCTKCGHFRTALQPSAYETSINNIITQAAERIAGERPEHRETPSETAFALFGLLVYIEFPILVAQFLQQGYRDFSLENTPADFSSDRLRDICQAFRHYPPAEVNGDVSLSDLQFKMFADQFLECLPQFGLPRMSSGAFEQYTAARILPFVKERKLGLKNKDGDIVSEGQNGTVYSFEVYPEYLNFPPNHTQGRTKFARKELAQQNKLRSYLEENNLQNAQQFKHPHIVKFIKFYRHGDTFNLIFPLAKTNLDHALRENEFQSLISGGGSIENSEIWKQVLGIAEALKAIADGLCPSIGNVTDRPLLGFHLDLKPANILIESDKTWVISDFGQAAFHRGSRVPNRGGTDAYAPPEIDDLNSGYTQFYDIWSLGCIILEVTAFVVKGSSGLCGPGGLDNIRITSIPNGRDSRFFCTDPTASNPKLKDQIRKFMDELKSSAREGSSREFIERILGLVQDMLKPEAKERIKITDVVRRLRSTIKQFSPHGQAIDKQMMPGEGEISLGGPELSGIQLWHKRSSGWKEASMQAFQRRGGNIRTYIIATDGQPSHSSLSRTAARTVPIFAFGRLPGSSMWLYFAEFEDHKAKRRPELAFEFSDLYGALLFQSKFTSQNIDASFYLKGISIKRYSSSIWDRIKNLKNSFKPPHDHGVGLGSGAVQLWTETDDDDGELSRPLMSETSEVLTSNMRLPRTLFHEQPGYSRLKERRLVLYVLNKRTIVTIPVDRNWIHKTGDLEIVLDRLNPVLDPHIRAYELFPPDDSADSYAGVPLCRKKLLALERAGAFEADSVRLKFESAEDAAAFSTRYNKNKKAWHDDLLRLESQPRYFEGSRYVELDADEDAKVAANAPRSPSFLNPLSRLSLQHPNRAESSKPRSSTPTTTTTTTARSPAVPAPSNGVSAPLNNNLAFSPIFEQTEIEVTPVEASSSAVGSHRPSATVAIDNGTAAVPTQHMNGLTNRDRASSNPGENYRRLPHRGGGRSAWGSKPPKGLNGKARAQD